MAKVGRPPKVNETDMPELVKKFAQYIIDTDIPIIAEFAYLNDVGRQYLYDRAEFSELVKKAIAKKEAQLEKKALQGDVNATMAIFSLKQLGWRDKQEIDFTDKTEFNVTLSDDDEK